MEVADEPGSALVNDAEMPGVVGGEGEIGVWASGGGDGEEGGEGEFGVVRGIFLGEDCGGCGGTEGEEGCDVFLN